MHTDENIYVFNGICELNQIKENHLFLLSLTAWTATIYSVYVKSNRGYVTGLWLSAYIGLNLKEMLRDSE